MEWLILNSLTMINSIFLDCCVGFIFDILLNILIYPVLLLSNIFSYIILKIFYQGYMTTNIIINGCTTLFKCSGECYSLFRFCYLTISTIFSFIIAWAVGAIIG